MDEYLVNMLVKRDYDKVAETLLTEYLGENRRNFEQEDLEGRIRILASKLKDKYEDILAFSSQNTSKEKSAEEALNHVKSELNLIVRDDEVVIESIPSELEDAETGVPIYKIVSYPSDPTLEGLYLKKQRDEIIIPKFQRGWVWSATQASKLVESFLLGLPVPEIFVYKESTGKHVVIDGQQRLRTIWGFFEGLLPDGSPFYLRGVSDAWNGKYYKDLSETDSRRFRDSVLREVIVEQVDPKDRTSIYHIFERLNTGGTRLTPQEVRNCTYHGPFNTMLYEVNANRIWRYIFGLPKPDARMRDIELIVRFLALTEGKYTKPMKTFLSDFMARHQWNENIAPHRDLFLRTTESVYQALGNRPFHIRRGINVAVYDSVMVAFSMAKGATIKRCGNS